MAPQPAQPSPDRAPDEAPKRLRFSRRQRLTLNLEYRAVYRRGARRSAGPLTVFARPNELGRSRLGLAVGRRVGNAVRRNRLKRLIRESFRLSQDELPAGYDFVVRVGPHGSASLAHYRAWLLDAAEGLHRTWQKRARRDAERAARDAKREPGDESGDSSDPGPPGQG